MRVAFELVDDQDWILRNNVIWNKLKGGMDNSKDRLGNVHENVFHFVKQPKGYYYNADAIRSKPAMSQKLLMVRLYPLQACQVFGTNGRLNCRHLSQMPRKQQLF
ncbi:MAG UNVERIFIED_CONTAM: site-specific DNA-methyltransferase [Microcystis novacekii LVE1205-3]